MTAAFSSEPDQASTTQALSALIASERSAPWLPGLDREGAAPASLTSVGDISEVPRSALVGRQRGGSKPAPSMLAADRRARQGERRRLFVAVLLTAVVVGAGEWLAFRASSAPTIAPLQPGLVAWPSISRDLITSMRALTLQALAMRTPRRGGSTDGPSAHGHAGCTTRSGHHC
ncbi:MAG: hypothetical protein AAGC46_15365 [Solirubrobacteraceae bacterium]